MKINLLICLIICLFSFSFSLNTHAQTIVRPIDAEGMQGKNQNVKNAVPENATANSIKNNDQIIIYGNESDGGTKKYKQKLQEASIPFEYKDLNNSKNTDEMWERLNKVGISGRVALPVVFANGKISSHPDIATLINLNKKQNNSNTVSINNNASNNINNSQLILYGSEACGWTQKYRQELKKANIPFEYKDINNSKFHEEMSQHLADADIYGSIPLPVVFANGKISPRPDLTKLIKANKK